MANRNADSLSLRWAGWPAALVILGVALGMELLPYIAGTGENARFDWAWPYVTTHFILLPPVCLVHIVVNVYRFGVLFRSQRSIALRAALSLTIPLAYLVVLYLNPVLPLWGTLTFDDLAREVGVEDTRRELEGQARRERGELPPMEDTLPGGRVRELATAEMEKALQHCRTATRRLVEAEVDLDGAGEAQSVELRTGSGEHDCDQAVIRALKASSWMPCQELGEPAACRVSYALSLGSPLHQGDPSQE